MITARISSEDNWIRCGKCSHKLGKMVSKGSLDVALEIKCHSCKEINQICRVSCNKEEERRE